MGRSRGRSSSTTRSRAARPCGGPTPISGTQARRIAAALVADGVGPGDRVADRDGQPARGRRRHLRCRRSPVRWPCRCRPSRRRAELAGMLGLADVTRRPHPDAACWAGGSATTSPTGRPCRVPAPRGGAGRGRLGRVPRRAATRSATATSTARRRGPPGGPGAGHLQLGHHRARPRGCSTANRAPTLQFWVQAQLFGRHHATRMWTRAADVLDRRAQHRRWARRSPPAGAG